MSQLIAKGINTIKYTNAVLRNWEKLGKNKFILLRVDGFNSPDFHKLNIFKDLCLDLARQQDAEFIKDIAILITEPNFENILDASTNRIILVLENQASFTNHDVMFTPEAGDLMWTNEEIKINNHSDNLSIILIIDIEEFLL